MTPDVFIPERLAKLDEIELLVGRHPEPSETDRRPEGCAQEIYSWLRGLEWTRRPELVDDVSPVVASVLRRLNDRLPSSLRQRLKPHLLRQHETNDGKDERRGWIAANWSIRVGLPTWLEKGGEREAAIALRELPEITPRTISRVRSQVERLRGEMWDRRRVEIEKLQRRLAQQLEEAGSKSSEADVAAEAAIHGLAAAGSDAATDALAPAEYAAGGATAAAGAPPSVAADAVALAAADAVAIAVTERLAGTVVETAVAAASVTGAGASAADRYLAVWDAVFAAVTPRLVEEYRPYRDALGQSALGMLDRMIDLGAVEA